MIKMESSSGRERKEWIDILRAMAIIFVIYGHALNDDGNVYIYYVFTSPIKIPLFFTISGYLFKSSRGFKEFFTRIFRGLVVPWLCLSILPVLLISIFKGMAYLQTSVVSILTGVSVWYMPCCIIGEIIFYLSEKYINKEWVLVLVSLATSCVGIMLINFGVFNVLMVNRALEIQMFLCLGYIIKKHQNLFDSVKPQHIIIGTVLYVFIGIISIVYFPGMNLDVHKGSYYSVPICFSMIIIGCTLLFVVGKNINLHNRLLSYIGKNTLICYIWASYPLLVYEAVIKRLHFSVSNNYLSAGIKTIIVFVCCCVVSLFVNRFLPEMVGKSRTSGKN